MRIQVALDRTGRTFTYEADEPVEVGDKVIVPGNWVYPAPSEAKVVALTPGDWDGPVTHIVGVVRDK